MFRLVTIVAAALLTGVCVVCWVNTGLSLGDSRTAAAGIAEVAVLAAMVNAGRWTGGDGFGGRPPAF